MYVHVCVKVYVDQFTHTCTCTDKYADIHRQTHTDREITQTHTDRQTDTHKDRYIYRQTRTL